MSIVKVSPKGAVVIPKEIRRKFDIAPGMKVGITCSNGAIRIIPMPEDPLTFARGMLKGKGKSLTQLLLEKRAKGLENEEIRIAESGKR